MSLQTGKFPTKMKISKVIPVCESGARHQFTNYRPVSLLSQFSKILEKVFVNRLDKFIDKHKILTDSLYGFRSNRSTSMALMELIENITNNTDQRQCTVGVFIDLKKAFDSEPLCAELAMVRDEKPQQPTGKVIITRYRWMWRGFDPCIRDNFEVRDCDNDHPYPLMRPLMRDLSGNLHSP